MSNKKYTTIKNQFIRIENYSVKKYQFFIADNNPIKPFKYFPEDGSACFAYENKITKHNTNESYSYLKFDSYYEAAQILSLYKPQDCYFHEVLLENMPRKFRFVFEVDLEKNPTFSKTEYHIIPFIVEGIVKGFNNVYGKIHDSDPSDFEGYTIDKKVVLIASATDEKRISIHFIIQKCYVANTIEERCLFNHILRYIPLNFHKFCEYNMENRICIGSKKRNSENNLYPVAYNPESRRKITKQTMITAQDFEQWLQGHFSSSTNKKLPERNSDIIFDTNPDLQEKPYLVAKNAFRNAVNNFLKNVAVKNENGEETEDYYADIFEPITENETETLIYLRRIKNSYCEICHSMHDQESTGEHTNFMTLGKDGSIYLHCHKYKNNKLMRKVYNLYNYAKNKTNRIADLTTKFYEGDTGLAEIWLDKAEKDLKVFDKQGNAYMYDSKTGLFKEVSKPVYQAEIGDYLKDVGISLIQEEEKKAKKIIDKKYKQKHSSKDLASYFPVKWNGPHFHIEAKARNTKSSNKPINKQTPSLDEISPQQQYQLILDFAIKEIETKKEELHEYIKEHFENMKLDHLKEEIANKKEEIHKMIKEKNKIKNKLHNHTTDYRNAATRLKSQSGIVQDNIENIESLLEKIPRILTHSKNNAISSIAIGKLLKDFDPSFLDRLDCIPYLFPIKNKKVVDLRTGEILERTREHCFTFECPVTLIDKEKERDKYDIAMGYLKSIFPNKTKRKYFIRRAGYMLTGEVCDRSFSVDYGTGSNGKSLLYELLKEMLGEFYGTMCKSIMIKQGCTKNASAPKPELLALRKKRLCVCSESEEDQTLNDERIKQITGSDTIEARSPHSPKIIEFTTNTKLVILGNFWLKFNVMDYAMVSRIRMMHYDQKFVAKDSDDELGPNEHISDPELGIEMKTKYLDALFTIFVEGAVEFYKTKKLYCPPIIKNEIQAYINEEDPVKKFVESHIIKTDSKGDRIFRSEFNKYFKDFCCVKSLKDKQYKDIVKRMEELGFPSKDQRTSKGYYYSKCKWNNKVINDDINEE